MRYKVVFYGSKNFDNEEQFKNLFEKLNNAGVKQFLISDDDIYVSDKMSDRIPADYKMIKDKIISLNCKRTEMLFIGFSLADYKTANSFGIDFVGISLTEKDNLFEYGCYTVHTITELENVVFDCRTVDLHMHSVFSDGTKTPTELVCEAAEKDISAIAVTDHDSVNGVSEALEAGKKYGVEVIQGIEFSVFEDTDIHIIGLFVDVNNKTLLDTIDKLHRIRINRMYKMCENLRNLGFPVTYEEALEFSDTGFVGRPHISKVLVKKGYFDTVSEVFDKYLGSGKPAYSPKTELSARDAVYAINEAGGKAFFAHLNQTGYGESKIRTVLSEMKGFGLAGIEGYYSEYYDKDYVEFRTIAGEYGLLFGGGSDYHGAMKPGLDMGMGYGTLEIPYFALQNIKNRI